VTADVRNSDWAIEVGAYPEAPEGRLVEWRFRCLSGV